MEKLDREFQEVKSTNLSQPNRKSGNMKSNLFRHSHRQVKFNL